MLLALACSNGSPPAQSSDPGSARTDQGGLVAGSGGTGASGGASMAASGGAGPAAGNGGAGSAASGGAGPAGSGGAGTPASASGACPVVAPENGIACDAELACTYGESPQLECRTYAKCMASPMGMRWSVGTAPCASAARCPATLPADGTVCDEADLRTVCYYPDGTVCGGCSTCIDEAPPGTRIFPCHGQPQGTLLWSCTPPPTTLAGCPELVPNDGSPCDLEQGTVCYRHGCNGVQTLDVTCDAGVWRWVTMKCSIPLAVCASPDTPIATPSGERPIASLRVGDWVYSSDGLGTLLVPIVRVQRTPVSGHRVVELKLDNGRTLHISGGHPTADGRLVSDLTADSLLDGLRVIEATTVPYDREATYDILPDSRTGTYYAAGALIGSTLR